MHPKVIDFIKNNEYLIDTADWDTLFDRMYIAFNSNTWIYPIIDLLEEGLPEFKSDIAAMKLIKYRNKVYEIMTSHNISVITSNFLLGQLKHSFGLNTDEMRLALESDPRFKVGVKNRYDYQVRLI